MHKEQLNFKGESYWQLLMEVTGNIKGRWKKFPLHNSTATSRARGGSYEGKKRDMQRRPRYQKATRKLGSRRKGKREHKDI